MELRIGSLGVKTFQRQFAVPVDNGQQVVEVVRHSPCQAPHRFHFLCLAELTLQAPSLGNVLGDAGVVGEPSRVVPDGETAVPNPTRTSVGVNHAVFVIERLSHLLKLEVGKNSFPIVRMDALDEGDGVFQQALSRASPDPFIGWTDVSNFGDVRVGNPEDLVDVLLDQLESLFASAEGCLPPFCFS